MNIWKTVGEVIAAALAVIGFYALLRFIGEVFLASGQITAALLLRTPEELSSLDLLLGEADRHSLRHRKQRTVVLLDRRLLVGEPGEDPVPDRRTQRLLEQYGAVWYPVDLAEADEAARKPESREG